MSIRRLSLFDQLSIRTTLVLVILSSTLIVGATLAAITLASELRTLKQNRLQEASTATRVLAQDFAKVLLLDTPEVAADAVSRLDAFNEVLAVRLYAHHAKEAAFAYEREGYQAGAPPVGLDSTVMFETDYAHILLPIEHEAMRHGSAYFVLDMRDINTQIGAHFTEFALTLLIIFIAALLAAGFFQRLVSAPLIRLSESVERITREQDYTLRLPVTNNNEIGIVLRGFNNMLARIQETTHTLHTEKERLQITLNAIGDGVVTTDASGRIQYLNPMAETLLGVGGDTLHGQAVEEALALLDETSAQPMDHPVLTCLRRREIVNLGQHAVLLNRQGERLAVEASSAPIRDKDGEIIGAIMVFHDVTTARNMAEQLARQATHDALTGLLNRYVFEARLQDAIIDARRSRRAHALIFVDLNKFKVVNDTCGYTAGDELLRQLSTILHGQIRPQDTLARLGGNEFGILLEDCAIEEAAELADALIERIRRYEFAWQDQLINIGASLGLARIDTDFDDAHALLSAADAACNAAKQEGWNRVRIYHHEDAELGQRRGEIESISSINDALREDRFILFAQPIVPLVEADAGEAHYEVLIRMRDEDGGILPPGSFLPAAERYGLSPALDRWIVSHLFAWLSEHPAHLASLDLCTVNLSGYSITNPAFLDHVLESFERHTIPCHKICFEVTETAAIGNIDKAVHFISTLHAHGARFALDDFGSGMSSFGYLKRLPVDFLKIDGSFVRNIEHDPMDLAMVQSIHEIAKTLGKLTIAEFVENQAIFDILAGIGIDFAQGYHIAKPLPLDELDAHPHEHHAAQS